MNNYRGFQDTLIPLTNVNFFVGENSSGKTSVLALLELFSKPEFWLRFDFNAGNYEFGGYKDIVSAFTKDSNEFQVGLSKPSVGKSSSDHLTYFMMCFSKASDGLPQLARLSILSYNIFLTIRITENQIAVKADTDIAKYYDISASTNCFALMQEITKKSRSGYKIYKGRGKIAIRQAPLINMPTIIEDLYDDDVINDFVKEIFTGTYFPGLSMTLASMAPIRTTPKRTYDGYNRRFSPEGEHTPYIIRKKLSTPGKKHREFKKALASFGQESGLFNEIGITQFGSDSSAPFELTVTLDKKALRVNSVGYGVSQVLPVVIQLLTHGEDTWLAIQQPEVHLHPKAQAALGGVIYHVAQNEKQTLFIETHSDYLIDRFRLCIRDSDQRGKFAQVIFFERLNDCNIVYPMAIDNSGEYPDDQPEGFRKFFLEEHERILRL